MYYKIEITEISEKEFKGQSWKQIRVVPDDLKKKPGYFSDEEKEIKEFGYVPSVETKTIEKVLLSQRVDKLNLVSVIKAINDI